MSELRSEMVVHGELNGKEYIGSVTEIDPINFLASLFEVGQPGPFLYSQTQILPNFEMAKEFVLRAWNELQKA